MALIIVIAVLGIAYLVFTGGVGNLMGSAEGLVTGTMTPDQIAQVAANAGFTGNDLITAVAVALAESSGNPGVVGDLSLTPGGSVGLWQINLKAHPDLAGMNLTDPQVNANAAYTVYQQAGNSFNPWSTFKNNSTGAIPNSNQYISQAAQGVADISGTASSDQTS
jgi:hypothetical protein